MTGNCTYDPPVNFLGLNDGTKSMLTNVDVACVDGGRVVSVVAWGHLTSMQVQLYCDV